MHVLEVSTTCSLKEKKKTCQKKFHCRPTSENEQSLMMFTIWSVHFIKKRLTVDHHHRDEIPIKGTDIDDAVVLI
ncbi:hypothetical protein CHS0354_038198 [Potamilus streckersoni]|uniref:Uncharacterized protein n=1 Tax=Potamilus streckersoni TaxID=2493646 RepID=A0AAE0T0N9_9BIVA|nr:hypothetical protein CHS0354_038198 [Potamilus streckersoni]